MLRFFVILGDSNRVKSAFVQALLRSASGEEQNLEDVLALCHRCPVMISFGTGEDVHRFLVSIDGPGVCNPVALENWETLKQFIQQVQNGPPETSIAWVTVQIDCGILKVWSNGLPMALQFYCENPFSVGDVLHSQ